MEYYIYINTKNLTEEELHEILDFAKNLKMKDFEELGDNTVYLTFKDSKPFIYKITHTSAEEGSDTFNSFIYIKSEVYKDMPIYNVIMIEE